MLELIRKQSYYRGKEKVKSMETTGKNPAELIVKEIVPAFGRKLLEFGSCGTSLAEQIIDQCDYLALTDKDPEIKTKLESLTKNDKIQLIPDSELSEDCYFGRFHLVYTIFGFRELPHLVDEIMRLRRLILKGGKIVIIDHTSDDFEAECIKQLKRCGFTNFTSETFIHSGTEAFLLTAQK